MSQIKITQKIELFFATEASYIKYVANISTSTHTGNFSKNGYPIWIVFFNKYKAYVDNFFNL